MTFQARLHVLEPVETWPTLHSAALERFWDGLDLATSAAPRRTAAIYLLGYVAEILLKMAFFRVAGFLPGQAVELRAITAHAAWTRSNLHNLDALADLLIAERATRDRALDPAFAGQLKSCVLTIANHWGTTLRYKHTAAEQPELAEVYQNVEWLRANATLLWS
jgi:hypothetical protein